MRKNKFLILGIFIFLAITLFLMSSVSAFLNTTTITSNATNGTTWFKAGTNQSINFTFIFNTTVNTSVSVNSINFTSTNFTIWATNKTNSTGWTCTGATNYLNCSTVIPVNSLNITLNVTLNDSAYEISHTLTINISTNASEYALGNSNKTRYNIAVDGVQPTISMPVYTNATIKTALTQTLTFNVSVGDSGSGGSSCYVNINGTNQTISVASGWCNSTLGDLTGLTTEGNSSIKLYVNDTANNLNLSSIYYVQIDTIAPIATAVCSPTTVSAGDTFPCTCSVSDATSGLDSSGSSSTSGTITSTASTGVFTYTCSATDHGGLTTTTTKTYSVTQTAGAGSPAGTITTTAWTSTQTITDTVFANGYTGELGAKSRVKVKVDTEDHYIGVVSISGTKAIIQISSNAVNVTLSAGQNASVDVDDDGFYDVYVLLNGITNNKANLTIKKIHDAIPQGESAITTGEEEIPPAEEGKDLTWLWILIAVVVLVAIGFMVKKKKE